MARPSASAWLRGTVIRKSGATSSQTTRSSTPIQAHTPSGAPGGSGSGGNGQSLLGGMFGGGVKDASGKVSEYSSMDDACPVCKSDRYLNPRLRLLVSQCYHKMCESCIDRLFTLGPAPCPVCQKTLRKLAFMPQTFEDLTVEREVAVRRRLAKEYVYIDKCLCLNLNLIPKPGSTNNEKTFQTSRHTTITSKRWKKSVSLHFRSRGVILITLPAFNLINDIDVEKTEQRVLAFRRENAALIEANIQRDASAASQLAAQEEADRQQRAARARALAQEEEEERAARAADRAELLAALENSEEGVDAAALLARAAKRQKEKERRERDRRAATLAAEANAMVPSRGARARSNIPDEPHVPIQDDWYAYENQYRLRKEGYVDPASEAVRKDRDGIMRAGGYMVEEAWERALRCAVAGLDLMPLGGSSTVSSNPDVMVGS